VRIGCCFDARAALLRIYCGTVALRGWLIFTPNFFPKLGRSKSHIELRALEMVILARFERASAL